MHIAYCHITKGDEELTDVKRCISSVKDYVDSINITANHKGDKLEEWCEKNGYNYSFKKWDDDFSEQRNFNFAQAPDEADYIFWMDSDDYLIGGEHLRPLAKKAKQRDIDLVFVSYWYGAEFDGAVVPENLKEVEIVHPKERLIRPGSIKWNKRIHETPVDAGEENNYIYYKYDKEDRPMAVLHLGADRNLDEKEQEKRTARNRRLLEKELKDEAKNDEVDPRTLLYLMKIYVNEDDKDTLLKAIQLGNDYMQMSGWDEERGTCLRRMGVAYGKLGMDKEALSAFHASLKEYPENVNTYLYLSRQYYNQGHFSKMKHWLDLALGMDLKEVSAGVDNLLELKILSAELGLKYYMQGDKNTKKALEFAEKLYEANSTKNNKKNLEHLEKLNELNEVCKNTDLLSKWLRDSGYEDKIAPFIKSLPGEIRDRRFAHRLVHRFGEPRIWGEKEICYYANFGQEHFEKWSPESLKSGIGGSETAVIKLSKIWTKMGYKVTVYGDPGRLRGLHDGVMYKHWYEFNIKDRFNIFIQWRNSNLAGRIKAKKFYVDLHDIFSPINIRRPESIDKIFVKSNYQKSLNDGDRIDYSKFVVIGNGIET